MSYLKLTSLLVVLFIVADVHAAPGVTDHFNPTFDDLEKTTDESNTTESNTTTTESYSTEYNITTTETNTTKAMDGDEDLSGKEKPSFFVRIWAILEAIWRIITFRFFG